MVMERVLSLELNRGKTNVMIQVGNDIGLGAFTPPLSMPFHFAKYLEPTHLTSAAKH